MKLRFQPIRLSSISSKSGPLGPGSTGVCGSLLITLPKRGFKDHLVCLNHQALLRTQSFDDTLAAV